MKFLDAHHHFWDLDRNYHPWLCDEPLIPFRYGDYSNLRANYLPEQYAVDTAELSIIGSVHVEAEWNPADPLAETRWLSTLTEECHHPIVFVAQAQLDRLDAEDILNGHSRFKQVRGIRHKPKSSKKELADRHRGAPGSMDDPNWRKGYALLERFGYSFDLQIPYWHLDQATELAADFPNIPIIINHAGLPIGRSDSNIREWCKAIENIAGHQNVAIKLSGLGQSDQTWSVQTNREVVLEAIKIFGSERCMFASNFPVDRLCADLSSIIFGYRAIVNHLSDDIIANLFYRNAARIYRFS